ncbi:ubiA prenyltransferase domain-containing protein 1-like [Paramacrobiotus metropolitanus]|uniref:ubiA prenyltransferase domain-containing protein 1-like n=1 Tax=Paramacrobiotus metropolitanus TaxID=2943436 RepID=UPI0024458053|nr:ubiA prenyltransferase domain-containing protein 1-like [Paramacrobiotus metropolitanus]
MTQDTLPTLQHVPMFSPQPISNEGKCRLNAALDHMDPEQSASREPSYLEDTAQLPSADLHISTPLFPVVCERIRDYWFSLRPWSFTASLLPASLGIALAYTVHHAFSLPITILTLFTVMMVHAAGNIIDTYFDYANGVDRLRSDDRTLVEGILTPTEVLHLATGLYSIATVIFFLVARLSPAPLYLLTLIYFGGFFASYLYTGGAGLKYIACGDLLVFCAFGPVTTLFAYVAACGRFSTAPCWYSVPLGLLIVAVLHANNVRDRETDAAGKIQTVALLLGDTGSLVLYVALLYMPFVIVGVLALTKCGWFFLPLLTIPGAKLLVSMMRASLERRNHSAALLPQQTAFLTGSFGVLYVLSFLLQTWRV